LKNNNQPRSEIIGAGISFFYFFLGGWARRSQAQPVRESRAVFFGWVGPKGTSTDCVRQFAWEYVGIILDLLYVVYAEITYNLRATGRATWRAVSS